MGVELQPHAFSISALGGDEWSISCPGFFNPGKEPSAHLKQVVRLELEKP
jgi:hypothetical protein